MDMEFCRSHFLRLFRDSVYSYSESDRWPLGAELTLLLACVPPWCVSLDLICSHVTQNFCALADDRDWYVIFSYCNVSVGVASEPGLSLRMGGEMFLPPEFPETFGVFFSPLECCVGIH